MPDLELDAQLIQLGFYNIEQAHKEALGRVTEKFDPDSVLGLDVRLAYSAKELPVPMAELFQDPPEQGIYYQPGTWEVQD